MDDKIEYFVQITTAVQIPGGVGYRSFIGDLLLPAGLSPRDLFWEAVEEAEYDLFKMERNGFGFEDNATLIFYNAVPN